MRGTTSRGVDAILIVVVVVVVAVVVAVESPRPILTFEEPPRARGDDGWMAVAGMVGFLLWPELRDGRDMDDGRCNSVIPSASLFCSLPGMDVAERDDDHDLAAPTGTRTPTPSLCLHVNHLEQLSVASSDALNARGPYRSESGCSTSFLFLLYDLVRDRSVRSSDVGSTGCDEMSGRR